MNTEVVQAVIFAMVLGFILLIGVVVNRHRS